MNFEIYLSGEIGEENSAGWFRQAFKEANGQPVLLTMNSGGGSVFAALEMSDVLRDYPGIVTCRIVGLAASAASFLTCFCDVVEITDDSVYMVHFASGGGWGNADDHSKIVEILQKIDSRLVAAYVRRSGKTEREIRELMKAETWFFGSEILDNGFADVLIPAEDTEDRATAMARGRERFAASFHRPTLEEVAAFGGADLSSLSADDYKAARLFNIPIEEYARHMPKDEKAPTETGVKSFSQWRADYPNNARIAEICDRCELKKIDPSKAAIALNLAAGAALTEEEAAAAKIFNLSPSEFRKYGKR